MGRVVGVLWRNRPLSRIVLAFGAFNLSDWAQWLAILVYAYGRGGAAESGTVALLLLVPATVIAPIAASLGDRLSRAWMLQLAYAGQALGFALAAAALLGGAPAPLVYAAAAAGIAMTSLTRPATSSILPWLTRDPAELTAANAAAGAMESAGMLGGPALGGAVLAVAPPAMVYLLSATLAAIAAALVLRVPRDSADPAPRPGPAAPVAELLAGFAAVARLPGPRTVVLVLGASSALWGAVDVLVVGLAIDVLRVGPSGAGGLGVVLGIGGLAAASLVTLMAGRRTLAAPFAAGLFAWGLPLVVIGVAPVPIVVIAMLGLAGAGRTLVEIVGQTLLQRASPAAVLTRIFGVVETAYLAFFGLGSIAIAAVVGAVGVQRAFVVAGVALVLVIAIGWRSLLAIDRRAVVPVEEVALLRSIPIFAPLPGPKLERLAGLLVPVRAARGARIITEGDAGDRFYVVGSGEIEIAIGGRVVRREGPGASFGEVALLRDVPRTATVSAVSDCTLYALERADFLEVLTGFPASMAVATAVAAQHMRG